MRTLDEIASDGFPVTGLHGPQDHALVSLDVALRAYVSTTYEIHGKLHLTEPASNADEQNARDFNLFSGYSRAAFETIVHLQHFAELVVKDALRREHDLLVVLASQHHVLLHKLIKGEPVDAADYERLHAVDAAVALERACKLLGACKLDTKYDFIAANRSFLEKLNALRNRLWHRGTLVLRYRALDEFVGRYGLPFIKAATAIDPYAGCELAWKPKALSCAIDPLEEIEVELRSANWSVAKVAFLKEMARAAYQNPLEESPWFEHDNESKRKLVEATVAELGTAELGSIERITSCPVCGMDALVIYEDMDDGCAYTWLAKCEGCTLELRSSYGNPSTHGWAGKIEEYWWER
ncbi:hypothetical protein [Sorangium sp. So ce542]|uniref:hypothetical protein n=1 Tax=Sorangium sp. So ce542 TaxID=3133316 RepID=UPI003F625F73